MSECAPTPTAASRTTTAIAVLIQERRGRVDAQSQVAAGLSGPHSFWSLPSAQHSVGDCPTIFSSATGFSYAHQYRASFVLVVISQT